MMIMSTKDARFHSPVQVTRDTRPDHAAVATDDARPPTLVCRWERYQKGSPMVVLLKSSDSLSDAAQPSSAADSSEDGASLNVQQQRLKPAIADWIETSVIFVIYVLTAVVFAGLLWPQQ
jgi:hypothetical protein